MRATKKKPCRFEAAKKKCPRGMSGKEKNVIPRSGTAPPPDGNKKAIPLGRKEPHKTSGHTTA